jgi:site-specific recombinase XerD
MRARDLSASTLALSERWLTVFADWCSTQSLESPLWIQPQHLEDWRNHLLWTPNLWGKFYSPNSSDQALRVVRSCLRWAVEQGYLALDPTRDLVLGRPVQPLQTVLTGEQVRTLLEQPDPKSAPGLRDRALLALFYYVPATTHQASRIDLGDLQGGRLVLDSEPHDLDDELAASCRRYLQHGRPELVREAGEQAFFLGRTGHRIGAPRLSQIVRFHGFDAGLSGELSPRTLRRSYASHVRTFQDRRFPS